VALTKATIMNTDTGEGIAVLFNPAEYTLERGNTFAEVGIPGLNAPPIQFVRGNLRTLRMELFFDTYERRPQTDVRQFVRKLTTLLNKDPTTQGPPILIFSWGRFNFQCVLDSASQRFTMFFNDGTPARATVSVTFKEYQPVEIETRRGLFLGVPTVENLVPGETLSGIAGRVLGDPGAWREIAELNDIDDPRRLSPGMRLILRQLKRLPRP
jgi:Contractile injection system tube protein/LysM domain